MSWIFFILGFGLASGIAWAWIQVRKKDFISTEEYSEQKNRIQALKEELSQSRIHLESARLNLQDKGVREAQLDGKIDELQKQLLAQSSLRSSLEAEMQAKSVWLQEQKNYLTELQTQMEVRFKQLASSSLDEQSSRFAEQQQSRLIDTLSPFRNELERFRQQVDEKFRGEAEGRGELKGELNKMIELNRTISLQTEQLSSALSRQSKAQGSYGEDVLETILGNAGFVEGEHFIRQFSTQNADGARIRPDIVLRRPQGPPIVVDSKVSLTSYVRYCDAAGDQLQEKVLAKEVYQSFRNHIEGLSGKKYDSIEGLSDFVLLFTPVENAFTIAANYDPGLRAFAFERNVFIVTPSSLLLVVRMISELWQKERLSKEVLDVAEQARKLYDKACLFIDAFNESGEALKKAQREWDKAASRLEGHGSMLSHGRKLGKMLGNKTNRTMPERLVDDPISDDDSAS